MWIVNYFSQGGKYQNQNSQGENIKINILEEENTKINIMEENIVQNFKGSPLDANIKASVEEVNEDDDNNVKYRFQGTFYCPKSSKKCVCTLSTFYSQKITIKRWFKHTFYYFS